MTPTMSVLIEQYQLNIFSESPPNKNVGCLEKILKKLVWNLDFNTVHFDRREKSHSLQVSN